VRWCAILATGLLLMIVSCGEREQPDDQGLHQDIVNGHDGAEVTFDATVLTAPVESGGHERFEVKDTTGENLEIDHNTDLATPVPLHVNDAVIIHGQLYIDPGPRYGVHCTHAKTSSGCPNQGWIEYNGDYYE
jgi:hypothetical protein